MRYSQPYHNAVALQALIMDASREANAKELAMLGKTFATLEQLKLRLRMKPAPKPVDVSADQPRKRRETPAATNAFAEE